MNLQLHEATFHYFYKGQAFTVKFFAFEGGGYSVYIFNRHNTQVYSPKEWHEGSASEKAALRYLKEHLNQFK